MRAERGTKGVEARGGGVALARERAAKGRGVRAAGLATKWKKDAEFWTLNFQSVGADGHLDLNKGGAGVLKPRGVVPGKTVRITFDPSSSAMPAELSWRVVSEELKIDSHNSIAT